MKIHRFLLLTCVKSLSLIYLVQGDMTGGAGIRTTNYWWTIALPPDPQPPHYHRKASAVIIVVSDPGH